MMRRWLITLALAVVAATSVLAAPQRGAAYCRSASRHFDNDPVRVVLHADLENWMVHADGTAWTRSELIRAAEWGIARINESAGADIPFMYLDWLSEPTCAWYDSDCGSGAPPWLSCFQPNTITIVPITCGQNATGPLNGDNYSESWVVTALVSNGPFADLRWGHEQTPLPPGFMGAHETFERLVIHEIGHTLGAQHPEGSTGGTCVPTLPTLPCPLAGTGGCATMWIDTGAWTHDLYTIDDTNGLRSIYPLRPIPISRDFESVDLDSGFVERPLWDIPFVGYMAASSTPSPYVPRISLVGYARSVTTPGHLTVWDWAQATGAVTLAPAGVPPMTLSGSGPIATAQDGSRRAVASHVERGGGPTVDRHATRRIYHATSTSGGTTWTTSTTDPPAGSVADTVVTGLTSAVSDIYGTTLYAFRANTGEVLLQSVNAHQWTNVVQTGIRSFTTPALACVPDRCLLVTVEAPRPANPVATTRLQWRELVWNHSVINIGTVTWASGLTTTSFLIRGHIMAAAHAPLSGGYEFVISAAHQFNSGSPATYGTRTFLFRHVPGTSTVSYHGYINQSDWARGFTPLGSAVGYVENFLFSHP